MKLFPPTIISSCLLSIKTWIVAGCHASRLPWFPDFRVMWIPRLPRHLTFNRSELRDDWTECRVRLLLSSLLHSSNLLFPSGGDGLSLFSVEFCRFKAMLWMCEEFPLSLVEQVIPIIDLMARTSAHFARLRDFIKLEFPPGFPVKIGTAK